MQFNPDTNRTFMFLQFGWMILKALTLVYNLPIDGKSVLH